MKNTILILVLSILLICLYATDNAMGKDEEMEIKVREDKLGDMLLVGVESIDPMESEAYMQMWTKFFEIDEHIAGIVGNAYYGISYMSQNAKGEDTWGYMIAAQVKSLDKIPEGMVSRKIPARNYLVFEHKGPVENIAKTYAYIYGTYAQSGKHKFLFAESLERYDHRYKDGSEDSIVEIWVPVK
ncbi:MAG: GyrI-like domain-containing protein [Candidatus Cloacimonetes bacterium]|mgnify:FL=1|nr:GyrI-like domain-containing protein [Candidatus Cloacimonadota bacterium]